MPAVALTFSSSSGGASISSRDLGTVSINPLSPSQQSTSVVPIHIRHDGANAITDVKLFLESQASGASTTDGKPIFMNTWTAGSGSAWGGVKAQVGGTDQLSTVGELVREVLPGPSAWVFDADHGDADVPATWIPVSSIAAGASLNVNLQTVIPNTETEAVTYGARLGVRYTYTS